MLLEQVMNQRLNRLADQIQRTLAVLIRDEINDPRLTGFVTISNVKVSADLGYADIYVTILETDTDKVEAVEGMNKETHAQSLRVLNSAAGFLRSLLAQSLKTRTTPRLRFHYDEVVAHANKITALVGEAMQQTNQNTQSDDSDASQ